MIFGKKKRILIEFIDAATGTKLGFDEKKPKHIPLSFEHDTIIEFGGKRWKLVSAEPFERKKYLKAGKVVIGVEELVDEKKTAEPSLTDLPETPAESLFRSASRAAIYPDFKGSRKGKTIVEMAAWEWRQIELVPAAMREEIQGEFARIETIKLVHATEQDGRTMYRKQQVRSVSATALQAQNWTPAALRTDVFTFSTALDGLSFMGEAGIADETFAFRMPAGMVLYGIADGGKVRSLALRPATEQHKLIAQPDLERLQQFMASESLVLVDWERLEMVDASLAGLGSYLGLEADVAEVESREEVTPEANSGNLVAPVVVPEAELTVVSDAKETPGAQDKAVETPAEPDSEEPLEDMTLEVPDGEEAEPLQDMAVDHSMDLSLSLDHEDLPSENPATGQEKPSPEEE